MNALAVIAPVVLPLVVSALQLALRGMGAQRVLGVASTLALSLLAGWLLYLAAEGPQVYQVGGWSPPLGIVLVLDRLSASLLAVTALIALGSLIFATGGTDKHSHAFHPLFQFQLMGLNGAFLTGDLFNLFVFFEILLIASYGLLLHGGGGRRSRVAFHYVTLNLTASLFFLVGLAVLYGAAGTLNMADLARTLPELPRESADLARAGGLVLLGVFALKAAIFPLYMWLPAAYGAAMAPVAALFAVMTKVGIYAVLRLDSLLFGALPGPGLEFLLLYAGLATLLVGALGTLGAARLNNMVSYLMLVSIGTLLLGFGAREGQGMGAALYYLFHTTLLTAGLYLLVGVIARQRAPLGDRLQAGAALAQPTALGLLFFIGAIGVAGLPPLSGFLGKLLILQAFLTEPFMVPVYFGVLFGGFMVILPLARAGSTLFWKQGLDPGPVRAAGVRTLGPAAALILSTLVLALGAGPTARWAEGTAAEIRQPTSYIEAVLGPEADASGREERP
ncbi:monovalent cation/H+ antiporter subunit D [Thiohalorhabdus methylotrophus]|uniref:Monovalent cation/H+ antiporter subunit D n=1 Tax=Thiohalorhabdus methylotrophus TaxID=3242694 RepID=A0ABV4TZ68_9GAMM